MDGDRAEVVARVEPGADVQFLTRAVTLLQVNTPDHLRGRVMSLHTLVFDGTVPVAALSLGMITERFGAAAGWWAGGGFGLLAVVGVALWWALRNFTSRPVVQRRE